MASCAVFQFSPTSGWRVFDWFENSWSDKPVSVKTYYNDRGQPSMLLLHGTFTERLQRGRFCKQPHKYLKSLNSSY